MSDARYQSSHTPLVLRRTEAAEAGNQDTSSALPAKEQSRLPASWAPPAKAPLAAEEAADSDAALLLLHSADPPAGSSFRVAMKAAFGAALPALGVAAADDDQHAATMTAAYMDQGVKTSGDVSPGEDVNGVETLAEGSAAPIT